MYRQFLRHNLLYLCINPSKMSGVKRKINGEASGSAKKRQTNPSEHAWYGIIPGLTDVGFVLCDGSGCVLPCSADHTASYRSVRHHQLSECWEIWWTPTCGFVSGGSSCLVSLDPQ
ncbi:uncharacterized protein LOC134774265 [Penaeus indicus]|uniref:uncharacterized protein LOC134774265 n=1 Tax=Penaeus indicus TaxID=29960 RepID=UPI00300D3EB3